MTLFLAISVVIILSMVLGSVMLAACRTDRMTTGADVAAPD